MPSGGRWTALRDELLHLGGLAFRCDGLAVSCRCMWWPWLSSEYHETGKGLSRQTLGFQVWTDAARCKQEVFQNTATIRRITEPQSILPVHTPPLLSVNQATPSARSEGPQPPSTRPINLRVVKGGGDEWLHGILATDAATNRVINAVQLNTANRELCV
jgi:hypothetical protein